ncbi:MAG TPA: EamA family transporter [Dissulfurispiraceae bacterium]
MNDRLIGLTYVMIAITLESIGHLWLKQSAERNYSGQDILALFVKLIRDKWCVLGVLCFVLEFGIWTFALRKLDVSLAYQMGCLSFIGVVLLSKVRLGEQISGRRWTGIVLILAGSILVGAS